MNDTATKTRSLFPTDQALLKVLWLAHDNIAAKWSKPLPHWELILNQLAVWEGMWREWQDRRTKLRATLRATLECLSARDETHIDNLDAALEIIATVGIVVNDLERSDQRELLLHMVERVIVDPDGNVTLELQAPFAYLNDISDAVRTSTRGTGAQKKAIHQNGQSENLSSGQTRLCTPNRTRTCAFASGGQRSIH